MDSEKGQYFCRGFFRGGLLNLILQEQFLEGFREGYVVSLVCDQRRFFLNRDFYVKLYLFWYLVSSKFRLVKGQRLQCRFWFFVVGRFVQGFVQGRGVLYVSRVVGTVFLVVVVLECRTVGVLGWAFIRLFVLFLLRFSEGGIVFFFQIGNSREQIMGFVLGYVDNKWESQDLFGFSGYIFGCCVVSFFCRVWYVYLVVSISRNLLFFKVCGVFQRFQDSVCVFFMSFFFRLQLEGRFCF